MAIAYLLGKPTAKLLKTDVNIPLLLVLSIIPDIDILFIPSMHRGPTHSIISATLVFIPFFIAYRKIAVPYFLALISHSLIGDFFIGGKLQLFWPLTPAQYGLHELNSYYIGIEDPVNVALELTLLLVSIVVMLKTKDIIRFFNGNKSNLILTIPIFTVLLPTFVGYPFDIPLITVLPAEAAGHVFYIVLFAVSVLTALKKILKRKSS
jgi:membrane-bound metal-dependent hydrolase YbcI (DUF457 family)